MDPSALIFVALAVAWAVYLVPKALEHHDESLRRRTVASVSRTMRVLARRDRGDLTTQRRAPARPSRPEPSSVPAPRPAAEGGRAYADVPVELTPAQRRARRAAAQQAAKRRRRVLGAILVALLALVVLAATSVVAWPWVAAPGALLVAWLVACRLMVRKERAVSMVRVPAAPPVEEPIVEPAVGADGSSVTMSRLMVTDEDGNPTGQFLTVEDTSVGRWDPVQVPLPTYVGKPVAERTVRTIDLDGTGVWSSGRNEADSALAREAEHAAAAAREAQAAEAHRATGS